MRGAIAFVVALLGACASSDSPTPGGDATVPPWEPPMGAHYSPDGTEVSFRIASTRATRLELEIDGRRFAMNHAGDVWSTRLATSELPPVVEYGYRAWGPNWPYDAAWVPGSMIGFVVDVDADGNRFNPNKLVFDPYARELTHDPTTPDQPDGSYYGTNAANRAKDSGPVAPKGIVLRDEPFEANKPERPFKDEVIYEVHLRGLSMAAGIECAGTYKGAATRAQYLAELGVTAVEFLPVQETPNDRNDVDPVTTKGDNYWGYSTLAYFAPDRRYACDRSPGGPTREFREMVRAFHDRGIKVYIDVVYNHTAEGGGGSLLSLRGIDNAGYYQLDRNGTGFTNSNGVGADVAAQKPLAQQLILDSLRYWRDELGVDGYRFDLAPILGNDCVQCFRFKQDFLATIAQQVGGDLIAEPWGVVGGSYQVGNFPQGWSEWNDRYRDLIRQDQNQTPATPGWLSARIHGSSELYRPDGRPPSASVNFLVAHDGFTLHDLYACDGPNNGQPWPYGPSDGGSNDNKSWDHDGNTGAQRQAARTGLALLMLSQGVPMITGGDERLRSQRCNNNPYNLDSPTTWLDWSQPEPAFTTFARRLMKFRAAHAAFRPAAWIEPAQISWRDAAGNVASGAYMDDATKPVLAWRLDGAALGDASAAIYVAYNRGTQMIPVTLPAPPGGMTWYRVADTGAWMEPQANISEAGAEYRMNQSRYDVGARSLALFVAR